MAKEKLPGMYMDNFHVDVTARGPEVLQHTVMLALCRFSSAEAFYESVTSRNENILLFYWHHEAKSVHSKLPYKFGAEQLLPFITGWLDNQDYGTEPNIDGSCSKGWRLLTEVPYEERKNVPHIWNFYTIFAIQPVWAMHHK